MQVDVRQDWLLGRYAPPRDHRDRFAGTTAYALEATVVLDIIHVAAAMRRAVLVASSLKACRHLARDRMVVDRRTVTLGCSCDGPQAATGAAGALMRTETLHQAREYQRNTPSRR